MLQLQVTIRAEAPRCGDVPLFRYVLQYTVRKAVHTHMMSVRTDIVIMSHGLVACP